MLYHSGRTMHYLFYFIYTKIEADLGLTLSARSCSRFGLGIWVCFSKQIQLSQRKYNEYGWSSLIKINDIHILVLIFFKWSWKLQLNLLCYIQNLMAMYESLKKKLKNESNKLSDPLDFLAQRPKKGTDLLNWNNTNSSNKHIWES